jgi:iron(III) transport system ATP-binding protein
VSVPAVANALEVVDLRVDYQEKPAVDGVTFSLVPGQLLTLLGPSGCGKSTTLRAIAGLERPVAGAIRLFGDPVFDAAAGINVPTEDRNLSMVFQSYAIWPHMTVFDNVAFGLRVRRVPGPALRERVMRALELVGLQDFAQRPAPLLSGGQQQRVALARSFVFDPRLILFDEPLSNLDAKLRIQMRDEIKLLQARLAISSVFVTHDQEEALAMSDQVVVLRDGRIEQAGTPLEVYFRPRTRFVADFMGGSNVFSMDRTERLTPDRARLWLGEGRRLDCVIAPGDREINAAAVKNVHIQLGAPPDRAAPDWNHFQATIQRRTFVGDSVVYGLTWGSSQLTVRQASSHIHDVGATLTAVIDPAHVIPLSA